MKADRLKHFIDLIETGSWVRFGECMFKKTKKSISFDSSPPSSKDVYLCISVEHALSGKLTPAHINDYEDLCSVLGSLRYAFWPASKLAEVVPHTVDYELKII